MKIMHMADFHLDSAFSGFDKESADEKRALLRDCFCEAMEIAKQRGVGLVLIAGDLFDTPFCSSATRKTVFEAIKRAGCPVVISPGNHDYYIKNGTYADASLPENVYVFSSAELGRFDFDEIGISVIGYAFTSDRYEKNPLAQEIPLSSENMNILCAHTELGVPLSKYAPMTGSGIALGGFTYAALGHVHIAPSPIKVGETVIAYSGFPQGRSFDERGDGGVCIVEIDPLDRRVEDIENVVVSKMSYEVERLDITGARDDSDVQKKLSELISSRGYGERTALRVILTGAIPSDNTINERAIAEDVAGYGLALLQIKNQCATNFDLDHLKNDMTVRGEVYRRLLPMLESEDGRERERAALALKFALAALDKRELSLD